VDVRPGDNASVIASREDREVVLPASGIAYSVEDSARLVGELNPSPWVPPARGRPGSPAFAEVIAAYRRTGLPTVGVGRRWGPLLPQIRDPTDDAPPLQRIDQDVEAVARQRWSWAQPWHPETVTIENRDDVLKRTALWQPETKSGKPATKWQPSRHVAMCMWASCHRHVSGKEDEGVAELIGAKDPRTVRRAIARGNQVWASLGAWPWAARDSGALAVDWWESDDIWEALSAEVALRVRRGQQLITALQQSTHVGPTSATRSRFHTGGAARPARE
jgi:hypothetical protein